MLRLSLEIEQATGLELSADRGFSMHPPWREWPEFLAARNQYRAIRPLVLLRPGTDAPPVFMVHPVGGSTMQLIPMAKSFPWPSAGLRHSGERLRRHGRTE